MLREIHATLKEETRRVRANVAAESDSDESLCSVKLARSVVDAARNLFFCNERWFQCALRTESGKL